MEPNIQPFKEPRGFIKIPQWLFAICAFAVAVDYSGKFGFNMTCMVGPGGVPGNQSVRATALVKYPFDLEHEEFSFEPPIRQLNCAESTIGPIGNAKSEAVFFVFTGVISFLYATVMIGVYLLADKQYMDNKRAPFIDFCITVLLAVFWIAGASAWAHGVSAIGDAIEASGWAPQQKTCAFDFKCDGFFYSSTSKLVVSVLFGFMNFTLWAGNIWFLYKETAYVLNGLGFGGGGGGGAQTNQQPGPGSTA